MADTDSSSQSQRPALDGLDARRLLQEGLTPEDDPGPEPVMNLPGYVFEGLVGRGGMGAVYRARQLSLEREVAVKRVPPEARDPAGLFARLEREARVMARLRHPNLVQVHDFLRLEDGSAAIVMEWVSGGTLRERLKDYPEGLPLNEFLALAGQIVAGVVAAHSQDLVHRDLKPENVLIDGVSDSARVTDFGLALQLGEATERLTADRATLGTLGYMAPEQMEGSTVDGRADLYSLGVVFHEMLTGVRPGKDERGLREMRSDISPALEAVVERCLQRQPKQRYATAVELQNALANAAQASPVEVEEDVVEEEQGAPVAVSPRKWMWAAGLLALLGLVAWPWIPNPPEPPGAGGEWVQLLDAVAPEVHGIHGEWRRTAQGIEAVGLESVNLLIVPVARPAERYAVRLRFTRLSGDYSIALFFRTPQGLGALEVDAWEQPGLSGIQMIDGLDLRAVESFDFTAPQGASRELLLEVRPPIVRVFSGGRLLLEHNLSGRNLGITTPWGWDGSVPDAGLVLASWQTATRFESLEWQQLP